MKNHFLAIHPLLGTKNKRAALHLQQRSPYYWWWAFLRRNVDYLACCEQEGKGKLSKLYKDFGDVRGDNFFTWWGGSLQRGQLLFAEKKPDIKLRQLTNKQEWLSYWSDSDQVVIFAVNMSLGRRLLQQLFGTELAKLHKGKRGRVALSTVTSTAMYPLHRNFSQHNLRIMLETYDVWLANQQLPKEQKMTLWEIGDSIKLVADAVSRKSDTPAERTAKHNVMSVAVSRYVRNAKVIIANTAKGEFPNSIL
jgi:hypothetical protein